MLEKRLSARTPLFLPPLFGFEQGCAERGTCQRFGIQSELIEHQGRAENCGFVTSFESLQASSKCHATLVVSATQFLTCCLLSHGTRSVAGV